MNRRRILISFALFANAVMYSMLVLTTFNSTDPMPLLGVILIDGLCAVNWLAWALYPSDPDPQPESDSE